eukprot:11126535-Lingulodinium_polyedra.AAC.1
MLSDLPETFAGAFFGSWVAGVAFGGPARSLRQRRGNGGIDDVGLCAARLPKHRGARCWLGPSAARGR